MPKKTSAEPGSAVEPVRTGPGRPINQAAWDAYLKSLEQGARFSHAAKAAGFTYQAVVKRRKVDPAFAEAEKAAEAVACEVIEDAVFEAARKGNMTAALHWLGNRAPERWHDARRPDKQVVQVDVGGAVALDAGASIDKIMELAARLTERRALESGGAEKAVIEAEIISESKAVVNPA